MYWKWLFEIACLREMFNSLNAGDGKKMNIFYTVLWNKCILDSQETGLGKKFKKLVIPIFSAEVGSTSSVVWSLICIFLCRWSVWSDQKCVCDLCTSVLAFRQQSSHLALIQAGIRWFTLMLEKLPQPSTESILQHHFLKLCCRTMTEMFRNVWADKVFKICFIAKIESNATNLFCQTETGHGCRWKRNSTNSSLLLRRIAWVPALSSGGHQHTQNPLWGENVGYQIGLDFISAKGIQTSVCKGKL